MREHRFAIATAIATFVLLIVGSMVHGTGSSLACPDWPLCYGSFFPKMENGVEYEHSHRLVATGVGIMTVALTVMLLLQKGRRFFKLGVAATVLVIFQGILGGITVLYRLPRAISIAHLATSMCFFSLMIVIALRTAPVPPAVPRRLGVGAAMAGRRVGRRSRSDRARRNGTAHGFGARVFGRSALQRLAVAAHVAGEGADDPPLRRRSSPPPSPSASRSSCAARRRGPSSCGAWRWLPIVLVVVQVGLGVTSVLSLLDLAVITTHLAVGAALLGSFVVLWGLCPAPARPGEEGAARP